ncbi:MAG: L-aspartate oxidase, partial [Nitrospinae bacterium]|nr:L-aspartate oxidase [Nitrospinota bacterium]
MSRPVADFLVIGSGVAGLSFALKVARHGSVRLVTKKELAESNTNYAQGGIAAVLADDDSFDLHIADTLTAGAGLCNEEAVRTLVENGPTAIAHLVDFGVRFSAGDTGAGLDLGREGGHSRRRIAHARDLTGAEIERALVAAVKSHPAITVHENHIAVNLITRAKLDPEVAAGGPDDRALGAYVLDIEKGAIEVFAARNTLLATGGAGKVFLYTSNPDIASGDGVAMAYRAGAKIANMEFMQFHPTCLYHPLAKSFLVSEAVRGEGAILKRTDATPFMEGYHELGSLAPRDIVARAIDREMKRRGDEFVYLDTTVIDPVYFEKRFPKIFATCRDYGYDPREQMLPVAPAAHYLCGGVVTDLAAHTTIDGLFAAGECACTGVHGANRLASNSLLEAVVFADKAAGAAIDRNGAGLDERLYDRIPEWDPGEAVAEDEKAVINHLWDEVRRLMWNYVGIARTDKRLKRAKNRLVNLRHEIDEYYWRSVVTSDLIELRNLVTCAML